MDRRAVDRFIGWFLPAAAVGGVVAGILFIVLGLSQGKVGEVILGAFAMVLVPGLALMVFREGRRKGRV